MDPLSPVASVLAIAAAASHVAKAISRLRTIGELPSRVYTLKNEVTDLEVVLRQVGHALEENSFATKADPHSLKQILARAKRVLSAVNHALEDLANLCAKSKIKIIARTTVWRKQKEVFQKFQDDVMAVKADLNVTLGVSNLHDMQHVILELRRVCVLTSNAEQSREVYSTSITHTLAEQQNAIYARMDQQCQSFNTRLDALAHLVLSDQPANKKREGESQIPCEKEVFESQSSSVKTLRVSMSQRMPCRNWCPCACHSKRKAKVSLPGIMEGVLGKIFVGYTGLPILNSRCDFKACKDRPDPDITMEYWFPWWFVSRNLKMYLKCLPNTGPEFQLSTVRRVPDSAQSVSLAMAGNIDGLRHLFSQGLATPRDISDSRGFSLVRWALYGGMHQHETVQFLMAQGALVDEISYDNVWDFMFRNKCSEKEARALRCITEGGDGDWVEEQNFPLIHRIIFGLSSKSLRTELEENPHTLYLTDSQGRTSLDWATARAQLEDIALLISYGADVNNMDHTGRTPVMHAVDSHSIPALRLVLEGGGNTNPVYPKGMYRSAPITAAGRANMVGMLKLLLQFDADPNTCNPEGVTALDNVARTSTADCAIVLLEYGADLNATSSYGTTALSSAIVHNNHEVLEVFTRRCYEYITSTRLKGPQLLPIVAEYADIQTMSILASSKPLRWSYDLRSDSIAANTTSLETRRDYSEKLRHAFEELISIARIEEYTAGSVESVIESGLFVSARTSWQSELMEATTALHSVRVSDSSDEEDLYLAGFKDEQEWEEGRLFHSRRASTI